MKSIMVMFDSLNRRMLEPYGCDWVKTPNFLRLASHSVTFDCNYVGSMPCMPARRELHTGRYNFLHRGWGPIEPFDDSMPEILKSNGIYSHLVSDHQHYWEDGGATYHTRYSSWDCSRGQEGDPWKVTPELMQASRRKNGVDSMDRLHKHDEANRRYITKEEKMPQAVTFTGGLDFLEHNWQEDNWFLQIETFDPHEPFFVPESYRRKYPHEYHGIMTDWPPYYFVTEGDDAVRHMRYQYAALVSMCDAWLGKVLDFMDAHKLWDDTMLIVNTDHGYLLGEHGWWSKTVMPVYDEIARTPLFIHDPRCASADGSRRTALTQTIDLPATVLDFFGLGLPADMQGRPLRPVIERDEKVHDFVLFGYHEAHINITDGRYVYMRAPVSRGNRELYEYTLMPAHMRNLFSPGELRGVSLAEPFSFTKGCKTMRIAALPGMTDPVNFGTRLYDLSSDPEQKAPVTDIALEAKMATEMVKLMKETDAPEESYTRFGLSKTLPVTEEDINQYHLQFSNEAMPESLANLQWTSAAKNMYFCLLRFTAERREAVNKAVRDCRKNGQVGFDEMLRVVDAVIPDDSRAMVRYFVILNSRCE